MCGTVTHKLAKYLNDIIRPYIDSEYMLRSSDEFLAAVQTMQLPPNSVVASLDVESLFTHVPVLATIDLIVNKSYNHATLPPPCFSQDDFRNLLKICTQQTPFKFKDGLFLQVDGVSMGSPLGPTFADFYMSNLENLLLSQDKISNPIKYFRYVDDTFCVFRKSNHVRFFMQRLKNNSILNFTYELMTDNKINFLDLSLVLKTDGKFETSVHIKPTDRGMYPNFKSLIPDIYKKSVVNALVRRAIKYSSSWSSCVHELNRIKQVLCNNDFPQNFVEKIIENKMVGAVGPEREVVGEDDKITF